MEVHPLKAYRAKHGLKLKDVADDLRVAPNTIWRWENWERTPGPKHLPAIAELTKAPLDRLLFKPSGAA